MANQHVVKDDKGGWDVIGAGNKKVTKNLPTQNEAEEYAKKIAIKQKSEVLVHGLDGKIRKKNSYGNDPCPPKDKK